MFIGSRSEPEREGTTREKEREGASMLEITGSRQTRGRKAKGKETNLIVGAKGGKERTKNEPRMSKLTPTDDQKKNMNSKERERA